MVITGTAFFTSGYTASVAFMGVNATSVVIDSATQVTATWTGGVPLNSKTDLDRDTKRTNLYFQVDNSRVIQRAKNTRTAVKNFVNTFALTSSTSGLSCSFNGGCTLNVQGTAGL